MWMLPGILDGTTGCGPLHALPTITLSSSTTVALHPTANIKTPEHVLCKPHFGIFDLYCLSSESISFVFLFDGLSETMPTLI
jgi:hypothetical protein